MNKKAQGLSINFVIIAIIAILVLTLIVVFATGSFGSLGKQLKIAETEKFFHLTYFFNGLSDKKFENEFRILVPSKKTPRMDTVPEMRAGEITDRLISAINSKAYEFIVVNYANPDVIAHTGNYNATVFSLIEFINQLFFHSTSILPFKTTMD